MKEDNGYILVPVDGSAHCLRAFDTAEALARETGATLKVLFFDSASQKPQGNLLQRLHLEEPETSIEVEKLSGDPVEKTLDWSRRLDNLLLTVVATQGFAPTGAAPVKGPEEKAALLSPAARRLFEELNGPMLLTRRNMNIPAQVSCILVPLDATPESARVVPLATTLAERSRAQVELLHVVGAEPAKVPATAGSLPPPRYVDHPQHEWGAWEQEFMTRFFPPTQNGESQIPVRLHMGHGEVETAIVRFAKQHDDDLIAMGLRFPLDERSERILESVVEESPCPVLVFPSPA